MKKNLVSLLPAVCAGSVTLFAGMTSAQLITPPTNEVIAATDQKLGPLTFQRFGNPSITNAGTVAFKSQVLRRGQRIVIGMPLQGVLLRGHAVPGISGATFMTFSDPFVTDELDPEMLTSMTTPLSDRWALIGTFKGNGISSVNNQGIFSNRSGTLALVARKGTTPWGSTPGTGLGTTKWGRFVSVAADGDVVAFTAALARDVGGANPSNNLGLWVSSLDMGVESNRLLLRKGDVVDVNGLRTIRTMNVLKINALGKGQGFGLTGIRTLAKLVFTDGTQALVWVDTSGAITPYVQTGITDAPGYDAGSKMKTFSVPSFNRGGYPAFRSALATRTGNVSAANNEAIFSGDGGSLQLVERKGAAATGGPAGSVFRKLGDPVMNEWGNVLFSARMSGGGVNRTNDSGLWMNYYGSSQLFMREGDMAPDLGGPTFRGFPSAALTLFYTEFTFTEPYMDPPQEFTFLEGSPMAIVEAQLNRTGDVTTKNDQTAWATDWYGNLHMLLREGVTQLDVRGKLRTVKSFRVINRVIGSETQKHSYNNFGEIVVLVAFTDKTQAIIKFVMPVPDFMHPV